VESIVDMDEFRDGYFFQVRWAGLPDSKDFTWHAAADLFEDIPDMLTDYLRSSRKQELAKKIMQQLSI